MDYKHINERMRTLHGSSCAIHEGDACSCGAAPVVELNVDGLRIDTFRITRSGGWSFNTDTGVRITHIPSGVYVEEKGDRSVHKNRCEAMRKMQRAFDLAPKLFNPPPPEQVQHAELKKAWDEYCGDAQINNDLDKAFIFAAGFLAGRSRK